MRDDFGGLFAASPGSLRRDPTPAEVAGGLACGAAGKDFWNENWFAISSILAELNTLLDSAGIIPDETAVNQVQQAILSLTKGRAAASARVNTNTGNSTVAIAGSTNISSITKGTVTYSGQTMNTITVNFATPMSNDRYSVLIAPGLDSLGSGALAHLYGTPTTTSFTILLLGQSSGVYPDQQTNLSFAVIPNP